LDRPACTLLHLGPGLANGLSNLHNALRAQSPVVNIIGDHATYHRHYDAPLSSDIEGAARPFSHWVRTSQNADTAGPDGAAAVAAALSAPGRIASLILPADAAWQETRSPVHVAIGSPEVAPRARPTDDAIVAAARILGSKEPTAIVLAGRATRADTLELAGKISAKTGARLLAQTHTPRIARGAGRVPVERIPYPVDQATALLSEFKNLILIGAKAPVAFFAYPNKPSELSLPGTRIYTLARVEQDLLYALGALSTAVGADAVAAPIVSLRHAERPTGLITPEKIGSLIAATLPEDAIVVDESITTGRSFFALTQNAPAHDWILPTGGSIGFAMPVSIGAAVACPNRKVITLESDGSGLYMPQSLWTQARQNLNVLTLVFANRKYQILRGELKNVGVSHIGPTASALLDIEKPDIDWVGLAQSFGVQAHRAQTMEALSGCIDAALASSGPCLIEVAL
ncbi:MAG: acetolactate synthase large subunit, partial [Burkholderiaceae bacterium]